MEILANEEALDERLSRPTPALRESIRGVRSPLVILGAGGKMGPTLAWMAKRAAEEAGRALEVIAVSRYTNVASRDWLEARGIRTIAADLVEAEEVRRLPDAGDVVYLVGLKFGTAKSPATTWAMNTVVPALVMNRYRGVRIAALSTGNVYPMTVRANGGALESEALTPLGEYANAAVGRERVFEFFSERHGTPVAILRLFYAVEMRYGVIHDLVRQIDAGKPVSLSVGSVNCIWQRDANERVLRSLEWATSPARAWNLCRPECYSIRELAIRIGAALGVEPRFEGAESETALLGNAGEMTRGMGAPETDVGTIIRWTVDWVRRGGRSFGKPTHFEVRDGQY